MTPRILKATTVGSLSALALAAVPLQASADSDRLEVYGMVDIGLESATPSTGAGSGEVFAGFNSAGGSAGGADSFDKDGTLSNGMQSRLGVRGGEQLMSNLRAAYNIELGVDVLSEEGGFTDDGVGTRLGWVGLEGDWGRVRAGTQWMPLYEFGGWNTHRGDVHGYGSYYYTTGLLNDSLAFGFRQSSALTYQIGSAWGHSDPFAFAVSLGMGEDNEGGFDTQFVVDPDTGDIVEEQVQGTAKNTSAVSSVQVAGQYTFAGVFSVNAVYLQEFVDYDQPNADELEVSLVNVGARWNVTPTLELGANYTEVDRDTGSDSNRDSIAVSATYSPDGPWSGHLGFATGSDDQDEDIESEGRDIDLNTYGFVRYSFTDSTNARFKFEHVDYDGDAVRNGSTSLGMVALQHHF